MENICVNCGHGIYLFDDYSAMHLAKVVRGEHYTNQLSESCRTRNCRCKKPEFKLLRRKF